MFDVNTLLSISNSIGEPFRVDPINVNRMNLRSARVCVELDVAKPFIDSIWVCFEDDDSKEVLEGFWVKVFYAVVPPFCTFCSHIGHAMEECKRNKVEDSNVTSHQIGVVEDMGQLSDNNSVFSRVMNHADKVLDGLPQPEFFKKWRKVVYKKVWHPIMSKEHCVGIVKAHASAGQMGQVQQNICTETMHQILAKSGSHRQIEEAKDAESDAQVE
ncbi:hypothetical protein LIER_18266 [Lithospermum erythrorhizon]|uniref:DUF4283 domain-containing protein n=1 Tax=Lithospermum erythrorhizon TaxID=34254 RepID=A0AAV3QDA7_LITER